MPTTIETEVFTFDELDDDAKERAREWFREGGFNYEWWDFTLDQAREIGAVLGFDIPEKNGIAFSGFWSQGDGASFSATWRAPKAPYKRMKALGFDWTHESVKPLLEMADAMAVLLCNMTRSERDEGATIYRSGRSVHEGSMRIGPDGYEPEHAEDLLDIARDFAHWVYRSLEREWDYMNSDEVVDESIRANEYTFTADGKRFG